MLRAFLFITLFFQALSFAQSSRDALFEQAIKHQMQGHLGEAEAAYRNYLNRFGAKPQVLANLGALLAKREEFPEAIAFYKQALRLDPSLSQLHLNLGLAFLKSGQAAAAIPEFDLLLRIQPANRQAMQLRALALVETERFPEAALQFRSLLPSDDVTVTIGLATALLRQQKVDEARRVLDPLLGSSTSAESQLVLGQLLFQEGRMDDAMSALSKARELDPRLPQLRLAIGSVHWRRRDIPAALEEWRAEYAANGNNFEILYTLGSALSLSPATAPEGEALLRRALTLRPRNPRANYQLAKLVWQQAKSPEAIEFLQRATQADPEFREAFYLQGNVLRSLGRQTEAAKSFARVRELSAKELSRQQDLFSESP